MGLTAVRSSTRKRTAKGALADGVAGTLTVHLWLFALLGSLVACGHGSLGAREALPVQAVPDPYVEQLVARARALKLSDSRPWHKLLHYRLGTLGRGFLGGGYMSDADSPEFFLSPRGKVDPQAELEATLRALLAPLPAAGVAGAQAELADEHALCRFPARFMFLRSALAIDLRRLPLTRCPAAEKFLSELSASSVTLIFSAYYLNNPASMFGHTFLRFNKSSPLATAERRELLDYGIDYSADVDTSNALLYALKGLFGLFPGTFKRIPYYYKVRAYNDYESRDLWEYELTLSAAQLALLSAHLWELGHTYFSYYYLSENCSFHILSLLEAANPDLALLSGLTSPVVPADTIKRLYANPGLVRRVSFRPSLRHQFDARVRSLDESQRDLVEALAADADHPLPKNLPPQAAIATLDAAADLVDVLYARELLNKREGEIARRKQRLLERRAELRVPSQPLRIEPPLSEAPERGHGSGRVAFGAARAGGDYAASLEFRLALHDLADATPGFPELAAIEFMRARVQLWIPERVELEDASLMRVTSLTPQGRFDRKVSWEFDVGATTLDDAACDRCLAAQVTGGTGLAFSVFDRALTLYALASGLVAWTPLIAGLADSHVRLGLGPSGGLRLRLTRELLVLSTARWLWLPGQAPTSTFRIDTSLRWLALSELALGVEARWTPRGLESQALVYTYF